ncbi:MAG: hypothetical protein IJN46_09665 [Lachnospiraceae bacterium]|nr:hypothetical protein [Lachnospiraceae bacterium]
MLKNFIQCGFIGWGAELIWTGLHNRIKHHDKRFMGHSSIFMFPIYGMAALLKPCSELLRRKNSGKLSRGLFYMTMIFLTEYSTGFLLKKANRCPWDYSDAPLNINGLIRLDYAPCWFALGLFYEGLMSRHDKFRENYDHSENSTLENT